MTNRRWWCAGAALLAVAGATTPVAAGMVPSAAPSSIAAATPAVELLSQTPSVTRGGAFELRLALTEAPEDSQIELVLHGRVRSRTELAQSMDGAGLRGQIYNVVTPVASLPTAADGSRSLSISLDPSAPGGVALTTAGVYPLEIEVQDPAGAAVASLVTHVLVRPDAADQSPPLAVAVVARIDRAPSRRADGSILLDERFAQRATDLVGALAATSGVPATLAFRPETLDALLREGADPVGLREALRQAAAGRTVLPMPYTDASPDALVAADLPGELTAQLDRGRAVLADALGVEPASDTWLAAPDLGLLGARAVERGGVRHVVLSQDQVAPLRSGIASLSLAQPFLINADREPLVDALTIDQGVAERLGTQAAPGLGVSRVLAELAVLWFEQPGIARAVVVPVDTSVRRAVVEGLLAGLDTGGLFEPTGLDDAFANASPLRQPGGGRVDRVLEPADLRSISAAVARELTAARPLVASLGTMLGADHAAVLAAESHLLVATSAGLGTTARRAHVLTARTAVDETAAAVTAPARESITLTAREGSVPLTLENRTGGPVDVVVHLRSSKVEFPEGNAMPIRLNDPTTRLNVPIRARASGTFPLVVSVTSPDGVLTLARTDYTVQSTAVSGVGLVLSIGAAVFLLVWWARHWRTRRSEKLVQTSEPG